ncbi:helix-turn-helix domain-containing protein [Aquibacillus albus]|uniref:Transcriptional regulator with XRE-family HTH domain n=1 Tax=Aquibacillus albus TaxID=1168171 RepID=A0ABS2N0G6_9BACI|nr:helix-turn-helix transcriptional regulator [Aquibacillus albus]MBM7571395.1 transcriptional regulator with XRE-family HTH domain [Aquibacillus albus]
MKNKGLDGRILGQIIRDLRLERKAKDKTWTIAYLAEQAEMDEDHLGHIERGNKKEPQFVTIGRLAKALDISLDDIWEQYEQEFKKYYPDDE